MNYLSCFLRNVIILLFSLVWLSACSVGSSSNSSSSTTTSGTTTPSDPPSPTFTTSFDDPGDEVIAGGVGLVGTYNVQAFSVVGVESETATDPRLAVKYNANGEIASIDVYASEQRPSFEGFKEDEVNYLESKSGLNALRVANPDVLEWKYQTFASWVTLDALEGTGNYGSVSVGLQTPDAGIPSVGNASFEGIGQGLYIVEPLATSGLENAIVESTVTVDANFVAGTVDITSVANDLPSLNFKTGEINYGNTNSIVDNDLTTDDNNMSGELRASFYGPKAEEIGGTFSLKGENSTYDGAFGAKQN